MRARHVGAALTAVASLVCGTVAPVGATASEEQGLLALTNRARASGGVSALSMDPALSSVARWWAQTMADQGAISHNPDLGAQVAGWSSLAENVGSGSDVDQIQAALLVSPSHYANLANPAYLLVGIGVAARGGRLYVVEDFARAAGGSQAPTVEPRLTAPVAPANAIASTPTTTTTTPPVPPKPPVGVAPPEFSVAPEPHDPPARSAFDFVLDALRALDPVHRHPERHRPSTSVAHTTLLRSDLHESEVPASHGFLVRGRNDGERLPALGADASPEGITRRVVSGRSAGTRTPAAGTGVLPHGLALHREALFGHEKRVALRPG